MSEALRQAAQQLLAHVEDKGEGRRSTCLPFDVEALRVALSQPAPSPQPAVPVVHVGNLPTMNQDRYPALGEWWVQLWDGTGDDAKVMARVYGGDPQKAKEKAESIARAILALRPQAVEPMTWPKGRDVGRYGDMSPGQHLRVGLDSDNDAYVSVWDEDGGASVEFCNPGGGGGGSSRRTREALIALMVAIEADNAERPDKDWWARRNGITAKAEGGV